MCRLGLAWTEFEQGKASDYTVGLLMGYDRQSTVCCILDVIRARLSPAEFERTVEQTAQLDGPLCRISIPEDPGAGKFVSYQLVKNLVGFDAFSEREQGMGNKAQRAALIAAHCENRFVVLAEGPWNRAFIEELCAFPAAATMTKSLRPAPRSADVRNGPRPERSAAITIPGHPRN